MRTQIIVRRMIAGCDNDFVDFLGMDNWVSNRPISSVPHRFHDLARQTC